VITFLAPFPDPERSDGFHYRVVAADAAFEGLPRVYLELTPDHRRWGVRRHGDVVGVALDPADAGAAEILDAVLARSRVVYAHSIYQLEPLLPRLEARRLACPLLVDFHGAVPEEQRLLGHPEEARRLAAVEEKVARAASVWVCMSAAMERHLRSKYPAAAAEAVLYPLRTRASFQLPVPASELPGHKAALGRSLIYAGGAQGWQNPERIAEACRALPADHEVTILTPDEERFRQLLGGVRAAVRVLRVPPSELGRHHAAAAFGLILRDDDPVNRVALPGKLLEYLEAGVVPVVLHPGIGDLEELGYGYVRVEELLAGRLPGPERIAELVRRNLEVAARLAGQAGRGAAELRRRCVEGLGSAAAPELPFDPVRVHRRLRRQALRRRLARALGKVMGKRRTGAP